MSYGWLTESSLLPKPAKKINVDNSKVCYSLSSILKFKNKFKSLLIFKLLFSKRKTDQKITKLLNL